MWEVLALRLLQEACLGLLYTCQLLIGQTMKLYIYMFSFTAP